MDHSEIKEDEDHGGESNEEEVGHSESNEGEADHGESNNTNSNNEHHGAAEYVEQLANVKVLASFGATNLSFVFIGIWNKWIR